MRAQTCWPEQNWNSYNKDGIRTNKTVNGITTNYALNGDRVTSEITGSETIYFRYDSNGKLISMNLDGTEYYYFRNAQGDIVGLFDRTGAVVVEYNYDAWGNILSTTGSLASTIGVKNPYRYRGYRFDEESGLYYLQSRYYKPHWGIFLGIDNLFLTANISPEKLYMYCSNNPPNMIDKDGYLDWSIFSLKSDWAGRAILLRWLYGTGSEWNIRNNSSWTNYMKNNKVLLRKVQKIIDPLWKKLSFGQSKYINITTHMEIENGEDIIGYQYLHGTNSKYGDFKIIGTIGRSATGFWSGLTFTWNDRIDPNFDYSSDKKKHEFAKKIPFSKCKNYTIRISWYDYSAFNFGNNVDVGWLCSNRNTW